MIPKKSLGQHWLDDTASLDAMVQMADVNKQDTVLEIGPGPGSLTKTLVKTANKVVAVELDHDLASKLSDHVNSPKLEVIEADILSLNFKDIPQPYKIVANIPYYLTSNLVRVISETLNPPVSATLLVQKEVAERISARPGSMSILSVAAQAYWQVSLGPIVPAHMFKPAPKIDSQIVHLERRKGALDQSIEPKAFFKVVRAGFSMRRKTLLNSLSHGLNLDRGEVQAACATANINPTKRPQTLSVEDWVRLTTALKLTA